MADHFKDFSALYGTDPSALLEAAHQPRQHAHALLRLGKDLSSDGRRIQSHVRGDIKHLGAAPTPASHASNHLGTTGLYAAGCLEMFAHAAQQFDTRVSKVNLEWSTTHATNVCVSPDAPGPAEIEREYTRARNHLEDAARTAAHMLRHPQNLNNVRTLFDEGFIPLSALSEWPDLVKLIVREVNSGHVLDPKLALSLPSTR